MDAKTIIPLVISACALLFTAFSYRRSAFHDSANTVEQRATMTADIRYIRTSIDEIKLENRAIRNDLDELKSKVVEIEASAKSAHKRLDDMKQKG